MQLINTASSGSVVHKMSWVQMTTDPGGTTMSEF